MASGHFWANISEIFKCLVANKLSFVFGLRWWGRSARGLWVIPKGLSATSYKSRNSQKVGLDIVWLMQLTTFYKEMDIFLYSVFTYFLVQKFRKPVWLCERCLNILNYDLECKFCAQIHIDVAELPIMKHLSLLKLAKIPKINPSRIPQDFCGII